MSIIQKTALCVLICITVFAAGRYSVQAPEVKTVETIKSDTETTKQQNTHTVITTTKAPTGEVKIIETIDAITKSDRDTKTDSKLEQIVMPPKIDTLNVSALVATDFSSGLVLKPIYGASVTKQVLGPITIGAFGLTNGVVGLSLGLNF